MNETSLSQKVQTHFKKQYKFCGFILKTSNRFITGIPDLIGHINGRFFAIELKRNALEKPKPLQIWFLTQILKTGAAADVCYSLEQCQEFFLKLYSYNWNKKDSEIILDKLSKYHKIELTKARY